MRPREGSAASLIASSVSLGRVDLLCCGLVTNETTILTCDRAVEPFACETGLSDCAIKVSFNESLSVELNSPNRV